MADDFEMCHNCKRDIPCANYEMHTVHCIRNLALCQICDEPIPRRELKDHINDCGKEIVDASSPISLTGNTEEVADKNPRVEPKLETKVKNSVAMEICQYCKLEFIPNELADHENYCGSRTEQCPECNDYVMLKEWEKHQNMRLYHELAKKPCAEVFGRNSSSTSLNVSSWYSTPDGSESSLQQPFVSTNSVVKVPRKKYSEPVLRSKSLSRKYSSATNLGYENSSSSIIGRESESVVVSSPKHEEQHISSEWNTSLEEQEILLAKFKEESCKSQLSKMKRSRSVAGAASWQPTCELESSFPSGDHMVVDHLGPVQSEVPPRESRTRRKTTSTSIVDSILGSSSPLKEKSRDSLTRDLITFSDEENDSRYLSVQDATSSTSIAAHSRVVSPTYSVKKSSSFVDKYLREKNCRHMKSDDEVARSKIESVRSKIRTESKENLKPPSRYEMNGSRAHCNESKRLPGFHQVDAANGSSNLASFENTQVHHQPYSDKNTSTSPSAKGNTTMAEERSILSYEDSMTLYKNLNGAYSKQRSSIASAFSQSSQLKPLAHSKSAGGNLAAYYSCEDEQIDRMQRNASSANFSTSGGNDHREKLRQMLSTLRKDPMDDDLDNNDGSFFPCEFCGDPYPVEYLMRHQV